MAVRLAYRSPLKGLRGLLGGVIPVTVSVAVMAGVLALVIPLIEKISLSEEAVSADVLMIWGWIAVGAAIIVWEFPFRRDSRLDKSVMAFPVLFNGLLLILLAVMDVREAHTELTVFMPVLALVSVAAYGWPYLDNALKRKPLGSPLARLMNWSDPTQ